MLMLIRTLPCTPPATDPDGTADWAFGVVQAQYDKQSADSEAYLVYPDDEEPARSLSLVDGRADPESIRKLATEWNDKINANFTAAINALESSVPVNPDGTSRDWTDVEDRSKLYDVKKAALALDDSFYCFGERTLLVNEHRFFTTVMRPDQLSHVLANPDQYVSITVYPK